MFAPREQGNTDAYNNVYSDMLGYKGHSQIASQRRPVTPCHRQR
ncbi:MAG: hypothetical protein WA777_18185 [Rhodanobacter sp.]